MYTAVQGGCGATFEGGRATSIWIWTSQRQWRAPCRLTICGCRRGIGHEKSPQVPVGAVREPATSPRSGRKTVAHGASRGRFGPNHPIRAPLGAKEITANGYGAMACVLKKCSARLALQPCGFSTATRCGRRGVGGAAQGNSDFLDCGTTKARAAGRAAGPERGPCATRWGEILLDPFTHRLRSGLRPVARCAGSKAERAR
jgi:hypothetical protein